MIYWLNLLFLVLEYAVGIIVGVGALGAAAFMMVVIPGAFIWLAADIAWYALIGKHRQ